MPLRPDDLGIAAVNSTLASQQVTSDALCGA